MITRCLGDRLAGHRRNREAAWSSLLVWFLILCRRPQRRSMTEHDELPSARAGVWDTPCAYGPLTNLPGYCTVSRLFRYAHTLR